MPKLTRYKQKIFCGDVPFQNNIAVFGSLKEGTPLFSASPDDIQSKTAYGLGWSGAAVYNQAPALQDMNALQYLFSRQLAYLMQSGVAEYLATESYYLGSVVSSSGTLYKSLVDDNLNQSLADNTKWECIAGKGSGQVPLGAIVPITSGLLGAMSIPASGSVIDGFMRADGSVIPAGNKVVGSTPNLSNSIYLRGSNVYGTTGGSNLTTLVESNLPAHVHSIAHDHSAFNSSGQSANHYHSNEHDHPAFNIGGGDHGHSISVRKQNSNGNHQANNTVAAGEFEDANHTYNIGGGGHLHSVDVPNFVGNTGWTSGDHSHSIDVPAFAGNSGSVGSAVAFTNEPNYVNVIYLIRVN